MKSIANQYRDLKEGRMSQQNFMRNLRMTMPQYVTNVTSFSDAIRILKNKSILTESYDNQVGQSFDLDVKSERGDGSVQNYQLKNVKLVNTNGRVFEKPDGTTVTLAPSDKYTSTKVDGLDKNQPSEEELDAMIKKMEDEKAGEEAIMSQYDEELNEAKKKDEKNYSVQQANPTELRLGIRTELEHGDMELDKAKEIAYKNIAKDPIYYTTLKLSGIEAHPKKVKGEKEVPVKKAKKESAQLVDLVNGMQKVKMPKADNKKKLKENVDAPHSIKADQGLDKSELNFLKKAYADRPTDKIPEKFKKIMQDLEDRIAAREKNEAMRFQDLPADPEKYKIVRDSKNYIIKATNADGIEFQKGDVAKTYDGEEIKIAKFEESQGKVKAIYSTGMFFRGIDIDGLEAPKSTFRPGVNIGGSFEKMKRSLEEIVRETISEYFDGRDNLVNPLSAEDENNLNENEEPLPQYATKIATEHNLILMPQPLDSTQLYQMWKKEKGSFGSKEGVMVYDPSMKAVSVLSSDKKTGEAVMTRFIADRSGTPSVDSKPFEEPGSKTAYFKQFIIAG
jgi:hypothetical protein